MNSFLGFGCYGDPVKYARVLRFCVPLCLRMQSNLLPSWGGECWACLKVKCASFLWPCSTFQKIRGFNNTHSSLLSFHGWRVWAHPSWFLFSGSVIKKLAGAVVAAEASTPLPCSCGGADFLSAVQLMTTDFYFWGQQESENLWWSKFLLNSS